MSDVALSNAVKVIRKPDGSFTERKDPNVQTLLFDLHASGLGSWKAVCRYELLDGQDVVIKQGTFELSGSDGDVVNASAPLTFDIRDLTAAPTGAHLDCTPR